MFSRARMLVPPEAERTSSAEREEGPVLLSEDAPSLSSSADWREESASG